MPKLNDTQTVLPSTAGQREDGSFEVLLDKARAASAIAALVKAGLAEELETSDRACPQIATVWSKPLPATIISACQPLPLRWRASTRPIHAF